jgi:flagellar assembly protein FliH
MSSSAPKLQPASDMVAAPFSYAEAQPQSGALEDGEKPAEEQRRLEAEAYARGERAAEQRLRAAVDAEIAANRAKVLEALAEFARERTAYYGRIEAEVVELALAIARKILHRETHIDPDALAGIARVTLEKLDAGTKLDLYVHPSEATDWRHYFARQPEGAPQPEVHEDPAVVAGECRMETSLGTTEIGIESQLKEIETGLLDLLAERPETAKR